MIVTHSPVNDAEPLDVLSAAADRGVSGEGAWWQCLVATGRANMPATSRQFE